MNSWMETPAGKQQKLSGVRGPVPTPYSAKEPATAVEWRKSGGAEEGRAKG